MAESDPLAAVTPSMRDYLFERKQRMGESAKAFPSVWDTMRRGSATEALALRRRMFPGRRNPQGLEPTWLAEFKQGVFKDVADYLGTLNQNKVDWEKMNRAQSQISEGMIKLLVQVASSDSSSRATVSAAQIRGAVDLGKARSDAMLSILGGGPGSSGGGRGSPQAKAAYLKLREQFQGVGATGQALGPEEIVRMARMAHDNVLLNDNDRATLYSYLNSESTGAGLGDLDGILQRARNEPGAEDMLRDMRTLGPAIDALEKRLAAETMTQLTAAAETAAQQYGGVSVPKLVEVYKAFNPLFSPDANSSDLDGMEGKLDQLGEPGDEIDPASMMLGALDGLDSADPLYAFDPTGSLAEIRREIMKSDGYLESAKKLGLDPNSQVTFRYFLKQVKKKQQASDAATRQQIRNLEAPPASETTKALQAASGALGMAPELGTGSAGPYPQSDLQIQKGLLEGKQGGEQPLTAEQKADLAKGPFGAASETPDYLAKPQYTVMVVPQPGGPPKKVLAMWDPKTRDYELDSPELDEFNDWLEQMSNPNPIVQGETPEEIQERLDGVVRTVKELYETSFKVQATANDVATQGATGRSVANTQAVMVDPKALGKSPTPSGEVRDQYGYSSDLSKQDRTIQDQAASTPHGQLLRGDQGPRLDLESQAVQRRLRRRLNKLDEKAQRDAR